MKTDGEMTGKINDIQAEGLEKRYGKVEALRGVSLSVGAGELFGLVGPDGAGKTTLLRILSTLILPDRGSARVGGMDVVKDFRALRSQIGYMPGRFSLYQDLTVEENLEFFATLFGTTIQGGYRLIEPIYRQIEPFRTRPAGKLSGGMKQKLALCCALVHLPSVLFLDEPTTGVDPVSRKEFWEMLGRLRREGITILVSTPYMDEAALCDRIALMKEGKILRTDTPKGLVEAYRGRLWAVRGMDMFALLKALRACPGVESCFSFGDTLHVRTGTEGLSGRQIGEYLASAGHGKVEITPVEAGIEDCYMELSQQNTL